MSPAPRSAEETRSYNVIELIKQDHDRARSLWGQFKMPSNDAQRKQTLAWGIIREVSMHAAKEEEVLYPALRDVLGDMGADHLLGEHQDMKWRLARLSSMSPGDPNLDGELQDFMELLLTHMDEEEKDLLPRFAAAEGVDDNYLGILGRNFTLARAHVPSRPHPLAPNKPPLNTFANVGAGAIDGLFDLVRFSGAPPL